MNIAKHVISKVGRGNYAEGVRLICGWCDLQPPAVYRWALPSERGGRGGHVPTQYQGPILRNARADGISVVPDDFFDPADLVAVNDNQAPVPAGGTVNNTEFGPEVPLALRGMKP